MPRCFDVYTVVNERKITENTYLKMSTRRFHSVMDTFIKLVYVQLKSFKFDSIEISKYVVCQKRHKRTIFLWTQSKIFYNVVWTKCGQLVMSIKHRNRFSSGYTSYSVSIYITVT